MLFSIQLFMLQKLETYMKLEKLEKLETYMKTEK